MSESFQGSPIAKSCPFLLFIPISISAPISRDPVSGGGISPSHLKLLPERGCGYANKSRKKAFTKKIASSS
ncbi:hypothetical protein DER46DRAFT_605424 [Fusarium sp. MPI-SDFR-AT-0072]|nr:hypothetical protein DER46DRAFT_605424 [Fusarium sp. MPI-SDFR-AT-0072]